MVDGPFSEIKEIVAGYSIVDVRSLAERAGASSAAMLVGRSLLGF